MILRSVTKHVKDQNWFAVVLDLVIVVIGVFIGIQLSNWNVDRAGEKKAQVLANRLYGDLNNDHEVVKNYAIRNECGDSPVRVAQTFGFNLPDTCDLQYQIAVYESQVATLSSFEIESQALMAAIQEFRQ